MPARDDAEGAVLEGQRGVIRDVLHLTAVPRQRAPSQSQVRLPGLGRCDHGRPDVRESERAGEDLAATGLNIEH
jgi:hypothetical protein